MTELEGYRVLLRAYPLEQRQRYGEEMEQAFLALLRMERQRYGLRGAARVWVGAAWDALAEGLAARLSRRATTRRPKGGGVTMETVFFDLRYTLRSLGRRPVFAAAAIFTLAVGIGASTSVFTVVNGFMLRPLPYEDPDELIAIWAAHPELGWSGTDVNAADAWDWRERAETLEDLTVFDEDGFNLTDGDVPELVSALRVTPNFLSVLGRRPTVGRDFAPSEIGEGLDNVAILSDGFWDRRFARSPDVLGSTLTLDGESVTVVGILPPDFLFHDGRPDLLRPWPVDLATASRGSHSANAVARLRHGATFELAREELVAIAGQLEIEHPENEGWTVEVVPLHEDAVGEIAARASVVLMAAVTFILLMACVNVANLLLARAGGRRSEIAVRAALGAGRGRLIRQLLTESLVLAGLGGALGLVAANWGYRAIVAALPPTLPPVFEFEVDATVLSFTLLITLGSAIVFGLAPALRTSGSEVRPLRGASQTGRTRGSSRFGSALVVLQTAIAAVLLVGGGLLMKSLSEMRTRDLGFDPENVLTLRIDLPESEYGSKEEADAYWRAVTEEIRALPRVVEAGTTQSHPLEGSNWGRTIQLVEPGVPEPRDRTVRLTYASPGLFEALRFELVSGRTLTEADGPDADRVAIVNEAFVERYLGPDDDPLSRTIMSGPEWSASIVGVVRDVTERAIDHPPEPSMYLPIHQADIRSRSVVVRTATDPAEMVSEVQEAVWSVDADIPVYAVQTMEALVEDRIGGFAVIGYLMGVFALLSLLLGAVGIYGVTAYTTGRRTSEIGLRLAVGAERGDVVRMVVRDGAWRVLAGLTVGLAAALLMGRGMAGILVGVSPRDPAVFAVVGAVLALVSLAGLYMPAAKASHVDPVRALRVE